jgi:hypothetical protein
VGAGPAGATGGGRGGGAWGNAPLAGSCTGSRSGAAGHIANSMGWQVIIAMPHLVPANTYRNLQQHVQYGYQVINCCN